MHATTHESARGQGIFAELERKHEREAQERGVAVVLAFASAPTAPIFLGPLGWTEIARLRVWGRPLLSQAAAPAPCERFDDPQDCAAAWPNHVVRDAEYLNWRFLDSPRGYRVVARRVRPRRGRPHALPGDRDGGAGRLHGRLARASAARARAHEGARDDRATRARASGGSSSPLGFVPAPHTLHLMGKPLADRLDLDPAAWRFTLGDTDFF